MKKLSEFLQDNSGGFSATRLAFLLWAVGVLVIWMYCSLTKGELVPIDNTVAAVLAALMTGKVVQRFGEKSDADDNNTATLNTKAQQSFNAIPPHK